MRALTYKHKIWGENLWYLKPYLITFRLFNVLETRKRRTLILNLGILKFFLKKIIAWFLNNREICRRGPNYMFYKNGKKAAERRLINWIPLSRNRPEQSPSFFVQSFRWNQTTMRWNSISRPHHFFYKYQLIMSIACLFTVFFPLSDFWIKLPVPRNTKASKKHNGVIMLPL